MKSVEAILNTKLQHFFVPRGRCRILLSELHFLKIVSPHFWPHRSYEILKN